MRLSTYAKKMGISYKTAFRWWKAGKLDAYQLDTGTVIVRDDTPLPDTANGIALYARVSTAGQKEDLLRQVERLKTYATSKGYQVTKIVQEVASGMNDKRPKLSKLLTDASIGVIVVEHQDRLTRFGANYIEQLMQMQGRRIEDKVQLPKLGTIRLKEHGYLPTWGVKVLSATVSEKAGKWFVSVQVEEEHADPIQASGSAIGVDVGIKTLATLSTGETFARPKALRSRMKALKRASRQHSTKKKGSNNRKNAQRKLAKLHRRIANIRKDALHKATSAIVMKTKSPAERPSVIVVEDLNIQGMLKNHTLSLAISDVGLYEFKRQLMYKAAYAGIEIKQVSRWYPSSKTCHCCGWIKEDLTLADRVFVCEDCGNITDRDYNAARNLAALA